MKVNDYMRNTDTPLFLKDILNKTFLFDGNAEVKKIKINTSWKNNIRYALKVVFENQGRNLILTEHALNELCYVVRNCNGTVKTVRFDGKTGDRKGTHWIFTIIDDKKQEFSIIKAM